MPLRHVQTGRHEWYTPDYILDAARELFWGVIDLDPASSDVANERVKAKRYFTEEQDGIIHDWVANSVFLNPPYGFPQIQDFCEKLVYEYHCGNVITAVVLTNNSTGTAWSRLLGNNSEGICLLDERVKFHYKGKFNSLPMQGQVIWYLGDDFDRFNESFRSIGKCFKRSY